MKPLLLLINAFTGNIVSHVISTEGRNLLFYRIIIMPNHAEISPFDRDDNEYGIPHQKAVLSSETRMHQKCAANYKASSGAE